MTGIQIDRMNRNRIRRYHLAGNVAGVVRMTGQPRRCFLVPRWCPHVSLPIEPAAMAREIKAHRSTAEGRDDA